MESWKVNLISVWFGCFFTGLAISQILPFLPLYVSQLGVTSHEALSMWSGLTFSVTFLVSAIVSPMWGSLADRKGRKLMLLRASLGMAIAILLQAFATNVWQLFIKSMAPDSNNIAFLAGMIAAVPGVSALISAPRLGKLGDRIGTSRILLATLCCAVVMFFAMSFVTTPLQLGTLRFLLGFADGAMLPAVQTLLLKYSSDSVTGRIFGYNQSFMYLGNVAGPLIGASVSAMAGFRWVFIATAIIVFINLWQLAWMLRRTRRANA